MGIDNRKKESKVSGEAYVLGDFTSDEDTSVREMIDTAMDEVCKLL